MFVPIQRRHVTPVHYQSLIAAGVPPILARIYAARGVRQASELDPDLSLLLSIDPLVSQQTVGRLTRALAGSEPICCVGDFDCDGATATALLVSTLRAWGGHVTYLLPNRFKQGYGLSPVLVDAAAEQGAKLIITVDNGIAAVEGVERARALGIDVIVTDHHLPGPLLPQTPYIVNPNQEGCRFPSKALCGVGVAFYLVAALWRSRVLSGLSSTKDDWIRSLLDYVALGTVADVVPLDANNRRLITAGLHQIREGRGHPGIRALLEVAGIEAHHVTERDLAFSVAPRINAAGRLEDMHIGVELLLATSVDDALPYAQRLDSLNRERRHIEQDRLEETVLRIEDADDQQHQRVLVVHDPEGHEGVVGLIAGRLRERYYRPVIAFAPGEDPNTLKGSARSVPGVHIRDLLALLDASHPTLITKFGGHAMAAGLTISRSRFADFRARLLQIAARAIPDSALQPVTETDGPLPADGFSVDVARELEAAGPWGQAFPSPSFDNLVRVIESRRVGSDRQTLRLKVVPLDAEGYAGPPIVAVRFRCGEQADPTAGQQIRLHYRLQVNWYRGIDSVQLLIQDWQPA